MYYNIIQNSHKVINNKMGADCSCLREDPKLNRDEMTMQDTRKPGQAQEANQETKAPDIIVDFQISGPDNNVDSIGIQSVARGYLDRKEVAALKEIGKVVKSFSPNFHYEPFNGSLSSKVSSRVKKIEKEWGPYDPESPSDDGVKVISFPAYVLDDGTIYEGEWNNDGEKHGKGTEIEPDGSKFVGYFKNNKRYGDGRLITAEGDIYQGQFKRGKLNGNGIARHPDGSKYEGNFKNGLPHGKGREEFEEGNYEGEYRNGKKNGNGIFSWAKGSKYEGEFKDNNIEGYGHYVWPNGKEYRGEWKENKMHGSGTFLWPDGRKYEGDYQNDIKHGHGVFSWPDGKVYNGDWENGKQEGKGKLTYPIKKTRKMETRYGIWKNGVRTAWVKKEKNSKDEE
ncbi:unnamed protein product [Blepharisma stoltei]|uniref:MORN repeat protein n=1 Tax=Blepharisma stoltei TaxID=1481888 RepID=A0AAU9JQC0_9CILI|nr:unnamed protein product [Blepharisma stoltei]